MYKAWQEVSKWFSKPVVPSYSSTQGSHCLRGGASRGTVAIFKLILNVDRGISGWFQCVFP